MNEIKDVERTATTMPPGDDEADTSQSTRAADGPVSMIGQLIATARRVAHIGRRYPLPPLAILLLMVASILAVLGYSSASQGALLVIIVIGGVPLAIETLRQLWHREFGIAIIAIIAILAIAGSAALGQYLAGALIVLAPVYLRRIMLSSSGDWSGGNAQKGAPTTL